MKYFSIECALLSELYLRAFFSLGLNYGEHNKLLQKSCKKRNAKLLRNLIADCVAQNSALIVQEDADMLSSEHPLLGILEFLQKMDKAFGELEKMRVRTFLEAITSLPEAEQGALMGLCEDPGMIDFSLLQQEDDSLSYCFEISPAYRAHLVLHGATITGGEELGFIRATELLKAQAGYALEAMDDKGRTAQLGFERVSIRVEYFNYARGVIKSRDCPWVMVAMILQNMQGKCEAFGEESVNAREKALLPLANFAPISNFWYKNAEASTSRGSELFKEYARENGGEKLCELLGKTGFTHVTEKTSGEIMAIQKEMRKHEFEGVWRAIYRDLVLAAQQYPVYFGAVTSQEAAQARAGVEETLKQEGFSGKYPSFFKRTNYRGFHSSDIYSMDFSRIVGSYIECFEDYSLNKLKLHFVTSTVSYSKNASQDLSELDAFSGYFMERDCRHGENVEAQISFEQGTMKFAENEETALIAAKIAKGMRISRAERKTIARATQTSFLAMMLAVLIIGAPMFGIVMAGGMAIIAGVIGLIVTGSLAQTWDMLQALPLFKIGIWSGLGFAAIIMLLLIIGEIQNHASKR